jgi:hypothetical protein
VGSLNDKIRRAFGGWDSVDYDHNFFGEYREGDTVKLTKGDHKGKYGEIRGVSTRFGSKEYTIDLGNDVIVIVPDSFFSTT